MFCKDLTIFRISIAVAIACTAYERPQLETMSPESAAAYIQDVLAVVFAHSDTDVSVEPIPYPTSSKIPLAIRLDGEAQRLFWFYPHSDQSDMALELEGVLQDVVKDTVRLPA